MRPRLLVPLFVSVALVSLALSLDEPKGRKVALLVGVNEYQHEKLLKLKYAVNDVTEMAKVLKENGYEVIVLSDEAGKGDAKLQPMKENIERELKTVLEKTKKNDLLLIAFAGHGLQFEEKKDAYFCPSDARPFKNRPESLVSLTNVYEQLEQSFAGIKVLLVDACRDDPTADRSSRGINADSAPRPPRGVAALFSCSAGERAFEHDKLKHGVFFHYVLKGLQGDGKNRRGEVTFSSLTDYVQGEVASAVPELIGGGAKQSPNLKADLSGASPVLTGVAQVPTRPEPIKPTTVGKEPERASAPFDAKKAKELQKAWADYLGRKVEEEVDLGGNVKMPLVLIPPGTFMMGAPKEERLPDHDLHEVTLTKPFYMGKYEVTQEQYARLMGKNPSTFSSGGDNAEKVKGKDTKTFPVDNVSWDDAESFCEALSRKSGKTFALPSEAQWEYACRAGTKTPFHFGSSLNGTEANCAGIYPYGTDKAGANLERTCEVGKYTSNAWGLHDMHGNVDEWCQDYYGPYQGLDSKDPLRTVRLDDNRHILRGGSYGHGGITCQASGRGKAKGDDSAPSFGFRVVCVVNVP